MSGGHWNYSNYFDDVEEQLKRALKCMQFLKAAKHELDFGYCSDTCLDCARLRVIAGLGVLFDNNYYTSQNAIAVARDTQQNQCPKCSPNYA